MKRMASAFFHLTIITSFCGACVLGGSLLAVNQGYPLWAAFILTGFGGIIMFGSGMYAAFCLVCSREAEMEDKLSNAKIT